MIVECLYPNISGTRVCTTELLGDYAVFLCCKGCSSTCPILLEMAKVPQLDHDLDSASEERTEPKKRGVIKALRERGVSMEQTDDNYPYDLAVPNLLRIFRRRK